MWASSLVDDLVHGGLLVPGARHDVFVIGGDVAAQDGGRLLRLRRKGTNRSWRSARLYIFICCGLVVSFYERCLISLLNSEETGVFIWLRRFKNVRLPHIADTSCMRLQTRASDSFPKALWCGSGGHAYCTRNRLKNMNVGEPNKYRYSYPANTSLARHKTYHV